MDDPPTEDKEREMTIRLTKIPIRCKILSERSSASECLSERVIIFHGKGGGQGSRSVRALDVRPESAESEDAWTQRLKTILREQGRERMVLRREGMKEKSEPEPRLSRIEFNKCELSLEFMKSPECGKTFPSLLALQHIKAIR